MLERVFFGLHTIAAIYEIIGKELLMRGLPLVSMNISVPIHNHNVLVPLVKTFVVLLIRLLHVSIIRLVAYSDYDREGKEDGENRITTGITVRIIAQTVVHERFD